MFLYLLRKYHRKTIQECEEYIRKHDYYILGKYSLFIIEQCLSDLPSDDYDVMMNYAHERVRAYQDLIGDQCVNPDLYKRLKHFQTLLCIIEKYKK